MDLPDEIKYDGSTLKAIPGYFVGQGDSSGLSTIGKVYKGKRFDNCYSYLFVTTKRFSFKDGTSSRELWKIDTLPGYYGWNFNHDFQRRYMGLKLIKTLENKRKFW